MAHFDRFDICYAYQALENDWNVGGWLRERPSNQRRRESIGVQLLRMDFCAGMGGGSFEALLDMGEEGANAAEIYVEALAKFGLSKLIDPKDDAHEAIAAYVRGHYVAEWVQEHFPKLVAVQ